MSAITVEAEGNPKEVLRILRAAVAAEIVKVELALQHAHERIRLFEEKYGVDSDTFSSEWAAEDLDGKDIEYVTWAGEYFLQKRLKKRLQQLQSVRYDNR